jgi:hypothetical protein
VWATSIPLTEVAARFGYQGALQNVHVTRTGPSGRPLEITFDGATGPMVVDAHRFFSVLELRSTLFTLRIDGPSPAGAVAGEPVTSSGAPELPSLAGSGPANLVAGTAGARATAALGRAPWVGLAVLLLSVWGTAAHRATGRRLAPAGGGGSVELVESGDGGPAAAGEGDDGDRDDGGGVDEPAEPPATPGVHS